MRIVGVPPRAGRDNESDGGKSVDRVRQHPHKRPAGLDACCGGWPAGATVAVV